MPEISSGVFLYNHPQLILWYREGMLTTVLAQCVGSVELHPNQRYLANSSDSKN